MSWAHLARPATITTDNKTKQPQGGAVARTSLLWDLPTRLFHWVLTLCLVGSWITAEAGFDWTEVHFVLGYTSLSLILFRVVWGFVGTRHARFANFLVGPSAVLASCRQLFSRKPTAAVGHSPIGGWSVLLMLLLVGVQATTGLFISDDIFYAGPYNGVVSSSLAGTLASIHHTNFVVLQVVVSIHILAIIWYAAGKRSNLLKPMLSGRNPALGDTHVYSSQLRRALLVITVVGILVTLLVQLAPPPPVADYY